MTPYQSTARQDGTATINLHSISAMPAYENKSFEELRFEDYSQGNRGSVTPVVSNTTPSLFGGGGFGQSAAAPSPSSGFSLGGSAPAPSTGGLFGSSTTSTTFGAPSSTGLFGSTPAPAPAFGQTSGGLFGSSTAPAPAFGQAPAPGFAFGSSAPAPATGGLFGSTSTPSTTSAFGQTTSSSTGGGLFGSTAPAPAFGQTSSTGGGLFGSSSLNPAPAPFGQAPSSSFGFGFGATAPASGGGLFGQPAPAGGLFGSTPAAPPASAFGNAFGSAAPATTSLFGSPQPPATPFGAPTPQSTPFFQQTQQPQYLFPPNAQIIAPAEKEVLEHKLRAMEQQRRELEKMGVWNGESPGKSPASTPTSNMQGAETSFFSPSSRPIAAFVPRSAAKIQPRGFPRSEPSTSRPSTTAVRNNHGLTSPEAHIRSSQLHLVIRPESLKKSRKFAGLKLESPEKFIPPESPDSPPKEEEETEMPNGYHVDTSKTPKKHSPAHRESPGKTSASTTDSAGLPSSSLATTAKSPSYDYYQRVIANEEPGGHVDTPSTTSVNGSSKAARSSLVPKLTKHGYEVFPSMEELASMTEAELATVKNFAIKRPGYGMVEWEGCVDVRGADLDRIVVIEKKDISVYNQDEEEGTKPEEGTKLNRPAKLTFYDIYPKNGALASAEEKLKYAAKVEKSTEKLAAAEFISYDPATGVWKIRVQHFSRYALDDDSDEENQNAEDQNAASPRSPSQVYKPLKFPKETPFKPSRISLNDEEMVDASVDMTMPYSIDEVTESQIIEAEEAAQLIFESSRKHRELYLSAKKQEKVRNKKKLSDSFTFEEEGGDDEDDNIPIGSLYVFSDEDVTAANDGSSFCAKFSGKLKTQNSGLCLGRSFRVGWLPDGSFVKPGPGSVLVKSIPVLSDSGNSDVVLPLLRAQLSHSLTIGKGGDKCPIFALPQNGKVEPRNLTGSIREALMAFASVDRPFPYASHSFVLVANLFDSDEEDDTGTATELQDRCPREARRIEAVRQFLVNLCTGYREPSDRLKISDDLSFIFAAVSSGDFERASDLAANAGYTYLSVILATEFDGRNDISRLLQEENILSAELKNRYDLRILENIAGKSDAEKRLFSGGDRSLEWRHRLLMQVQEGKQASIAQLLERYEREIDSEEAPFPKPQYMLASFSQRIDCFYYRLLKFCADYHDLPLREVIDPSGFTSFIHDFQRSYHLALAISAAVDVPTCLSASEAEYIADGFAMQLVQQGLWDWAVFVLLCAMETESPDLFRWKTYRAKEVVLRYYNYHESSRRDFLEQQVGVPPQWFEEALFFRASSQGDIAGCAKHAERFDPIMSIRLFNEFILPDHFFRFSSDECKELVTAFVESVPDEEEGSLAIAMLCLNDLDHNVMSSAGCPQSVTPDALLAMRVNYDFIHETLTKLLLPKNEAVIAFILPENARLHTFMVSECLERLNFLKTHIDHMERI
jgi:nuclear pore complex protein Nup98-Nup96